MWSCMKLKDKIHGSSIQDVLIICVMRDPTMFNELVEKLQHYVKLGNNTKMDVMGKESVKCLLSGMNLVVTEVYYIPELKNNLQSIGKL